MSSGSRARRIQGVALALGLFVALAACQAGPKPPETPDPQRVSEADKLAPAQVREAARGAVEQYRQAYEVLTFDGLAPLYARGQDVEVIAQGRRYTGWSEVERYLRDLLDRANEIRVQIADLRVMALGSDGAIATAQIERRVRGPVMSVTTNGVLSLTFRLDEGSWRIVSEHLSHMTER